MSLLHMDAGINCINGGQITHALGLESKGHVSVSSAVFICTENHCPQNHLSTSEGRQPEIPDRCLPRGEQKLAGGSGSLFIYNLAVRSVKRAFVEQLYLRVFFETGHCINSYYRGVCEFFFPHRACEVLL